MIEIHNNKEKTIVFEVQLSGITSKELSGHFRMIVDGIEYGFPAEISESSISVDVPSLKSIIHRPLRDGEKFKAKLELVGNENYMKPWDDNVIVKSAVMVEAKVVEGKHMVKKPSVRILPEKKETLIKKKKPVIKEKAQIIQEPVIQKIKSEDVKREHLFMFMTKNGTTNKRIQEVILQKCIDRVGEDDNKLLFKELYKYYKNKNGVN
jgi:hypothetical protein